MILGEYIPLLFWVNIYHCAFGSIYTTVLLGQYIPLCFWVNIYHYAFGSIYTTMLLGQIYTTMLLGQIYTTMLLGQIYTTKSFYHSLNLQQDLGSISSEIQTLQEQSMSMNIKLKNRQVKCL